MRRGLQLYFLTFNTKIRGEEKEEHIYVKIYVKGGRDGAEILAKYLLGESLKLKLGRNRSEESAAKSFVFYSGLDKNK